MGAGNDGAGSGEEIATCRDVPCVSVRPAGRTVGDKAAGGGSGSGRGKEGGIGPARWGSSERVEGKNGDGTVRRVDTLQLVRGEAITWVKLFDTVLEWLLDSRHD